MLETKGVRKFGWKMAAGGLLAASLAAAAYEIPAMAQDAYAPQFTPDGQLMLPEKPIWRAWPYIGAIVTPNALNDGEAPFPEYHSVYIDPESWDHWQKTGTFREGTIIAKELALVYGEDPESDGSTQQVSGRGYFMGEFSGFEIALKSKQRYPDDPGYWAYFTFGHHAEPYAATAKKLPAEACNACHEAAAEDDFVFTQFYPVLRAAKGGN
jgi:hypothetical protein